MSISSWRGSARAAGALDLDVRAHLAAQAVVEHLLAAAAGALRLVHREVGLAQHRLRVGLGVWAIETPTLASIVTSAEPSWNGSRSVEHAPGERQRLVLALEFLGEDHELVAAEPRDRVAVAHQLGEALGDGDQQPVADVVAEVVVDRLEAVEVDEQQRDARPGCGETRTSPGACGPSAAVRFGRCVSGSCSAWRSSHMRSVTSFAAAYQGSPSRRALHSSQRHEPSRWR